MVTTQRASDWWLAEMTSEGSPGEDNVKCYQICIYSECDGNHERLLAGQWHSLILKEKLGIFVGWEKTGQNRSKKLARR